MLDRTPFYAEGGGQLADQGVIELANGARLEVRRRAVADHRPGSCTRPRCSPARSPSATGAHALVDIERRTSISRAHTATHMVHKAFREALGETATQAGSENAPGRFRFDFSATGSVPDVGDGRRRGAGQRPGARRPRVHAEVMTQDEAVKSGAMALFGEKYGDQVRVISVGDWARELCGGTHAGRSGQLGVIKLLGESVDRLRRTPRGGAGRRRRLPLPRPRARARRAALRDAQGAARGAARAGPRHRRAAAHRREGDREGPRRPAAGRRGRARGRATDVGGVNVVAHRADGAAAATSARWRSTSAAGCPAPSPAWWSSSAPSTARSRSWRPSTTRPGPGLSARTRWSAPSGRWSAARAAARTTSPRAAAATPRGSTRRSRWSSAEVARPGGGDA